MLSIFDGNPAAYEKVFILSSPGSSLGDPGETRKLLFRPFRNYPTEIKVETKEVRSEFVIYFLCI